MMWMMNPRLKSIDLDRVSWCQKGTWSCCIAQGLLDEIQVLGYHLFRDLCALRFDKVKSSSDMMYGSYGFMFTCLLI